MASEQSFVDYILEQTQNAGIITYKKMFGEYAIYCDAKVVGLVCDNQFFVKPTDKGRLFIKDVQEAPPYPGATLYFLIDDKLDDPEWISNLIKITAAELPLPKPKKKKISEKKKP
jgi:TfoX/Sxy family transcriptional regulator of competence genes